MRKVRILFYIKDPNGGTGRFIEQLYLKLSKDSRFEVKIITHTPANSYSFPYEIVGFTIPKQKKISIINLIKSFLNTLFISYSIYKFSPNIVYSLDIFANIVVNIISLFNHKHVVINSSHVNIKKHINSSRNKGVASLINFSLKLLYKRANLHIVPSKGLAKQVLMDFKIKKNKVKWIPYLLDIKSIQSLSKKTLRSMDNMRNHVEIVTIVRNDNQKDIHGLIQVIDYMVTSGLDSRLTFLGLDSCPKDFSHLYSTEFKKKYLVFPGWKKNPFMYLLKADIFILLSHFEGFSYAILEAQTLGKPVIASDVDYGPRELIQHNKNGILISSHNPEYVSKYILEILNNTTKRKNLINYALENAKKYDSEVLYRQYAELFIDIVHGTNSPQ